MRLTEHAVVWDNEKKQMNGRKKIWMSRLLFRATRTGQKYYAISYIVHSDNMCKSERKGKER